MAMVRSALILSAALSTAPFQCTSTDPYDQVAMEETAGQALYELAEQFKKDGDTEAWRTTLEHLIERYPSSRFATTARRDLGRSGAGDADPEPDHSKTAATPK